MILSFENGVLGIFEMINRTIYNLLAWSFNFLTELAGIRIFSDTQIEAFLSNVYVLLGIIMLFRLAFSVITIIVNPDSKSLQKNSSIFYRIIVVLAIIVLTPFVFNVAYALQDAILISPDGNGQGKFGDGLIEKFFQSAKEAAEANRVDNTVNTGEETPSDEPKTRWCYYQMKDTSCPPPDTATIATNEYINGQQQTKVVQIEHYCPDAMVVYKSPKGKTDLDLQLWSQNAFTLTAKDGANARDINFPSKPTLTLPGEEANYDSYEINVWDAWKDNNSTLATGDCPGEVYTYRLYDGEIGLRWNWSQQITDKRQAQTPYTLKTQGELVGTAVSGAVETIPEGEETGYRFADTLHMTFANKKVDNVTSPINCDQDGGSYKVFCDEKNKLAQTPYRTRVDFVKLGAEWKSGRYDYSFFLAFVVGIIAALFLLATCFDIALRAIKLGFLELIAPIVAVTYIEPSSKVFMNWVKTTVFTYLDVFIRLIGMEFAIMTILFLDTQMMNEGWNWLLNLFLLLGALMFTKAVPELVKKITGIDMNGSFSINPMSKVKAIPVAGAAAGALLGSAGGGYAGQKAMAGTGPLGRIAGAAVGILQGGKAGFSSTPFMGASGGGRGGGGGGKNPFTVGAENTYSNMTGSRLSDQSGTLNTILGKLSKNYVGGMKAEQRGHENAAARITASREAMAQNPDVANAIFNVVNQNTTYKNITASGDLYDRTANAPTATGASLHNDIRSMLEDQFRTQNGIIGPLSAADQANIDQRAQQTFTSYVNILTADEQIGAETKAAKDIGEKVDTWSKAGRP